jgi:CheY-like chemotaxis protein
MGSVEDDISRRIISLKVLIVDDNIEMRWVTQALLQSIGIRYIHEANDGVSGLDAICSLRPDIVLLDWEMPRPNGDGICAERSIAGPIPATGHTHHYAHRL